MFGLNDQSMGGQGMKVLGANTPIAHMVQLDANGGVVGMLGHDEFKVEIVATGVLAFASSKELVAAVAERVGGKCEIVRVEGNTAPGFALLVTVPLRAYLRDKRNFMISTQRKLIEVIKRFDKVHTDSR